MNKEIEWQLFPKNMTCPKLKPQRLKGSVQNGDNARGDGRCFSIEEVVHCPVGNMLVTLDVLRIKGFCSKI